MMKLPDKWIMYQLIAYRGPAHDRVPLVGIRMGFYYVKAKLSQTWKERVIASMDEALNNYDAATE